mgnify:CR=1 FL=1
MIRGNFFFFQCFKLIVFRCMITMTIIKKNGWTSGKTKIELKSNINPIYGIDYLTGSKIYLCIVGIVSCFVNYMQVILPLFIYFFFCSIRLSNYLFIFLSFQLYLDDRGCHSMIMIILIQNDYLWIMITLIVHTHTHTHWL